MGNLAEVRMSRGLTQETMASRIGIAVSTYSLYENGHRCVPLKVAEHIAEILECNLDENFLPEKFTVSKTNTDSA